MTAPNFLLAICFLLVCQSVQGISNSGNEFYLILPHDLVDWSPTAPPILMVTTDDSGPVSFTVFYTTLGRTLQFRTSVNNTARKGELTKIVLPHVLHLTTISRGVQLKAEEGKNIIVYTLNEGHHSTGAYLGLPYFETATKTYEYYGVSIPSSNLKFGINKGYMAVVILKNNTVLSITPTVMLEGDVPGTSLRKFPRKSHKSLLCDKGQTYIVRSTEDLTGSKISSNNPITFITGVQCGSNPFEAITCDHLTEQLPPADTFGFVFFLVPPHLRQQNGYKLVASMPCTGVTLHCVNKQGQTVQWDAFKLNDGQFRQLIIDSNHYCSIEANLPLLVVQIALGHSVEATIISDSFMTMVPPLGQYRNDYTFLFAESYYHVFKPQLSLCVPVHCFNISQILFDDRPLPDSVVYVPVKCKNGVVCAYCTQYEVPDAQLHGVHNLKHSDPKCTIGVIVSGNGTWDSYAYPAGMNLNSIAVPSYCFEDEVITVCNNSGLQRFDLVNTGRPQAECITFSIRDESYSEMKYGQCCFYGCHKEAHCRLDVDQYSIRTGEESTILTITLHALDGQRVCNTTLLVTIIDCQDSIFPKCSNALQPKTNLHVRMDAECDPCFEQGQVESNVTLTCSLIPYCVPSSCRIRNPDGITAEELVGLSGNFTVGEGYLVINEYLLNNPVDFPASQTLQGVWTCTCFHNEEISTASNIVAHCSVTPEIDKGSPHQIPIDAASRGSSTFKIGGSQYIFAGYNFTITCKVLEGVPSPKIIWLKNDNAMEGKANLTHITVPVSIDDPAAAAGRYTCKATNVAGMDEAHSQIQLETEILVPPLIWNNSPEFQFPLTFQSESDVEVTIGTDVDIVMNRTLPTLVTLYCSLRYQAFPNAKFTWTRNEQPLDDTDMIKIKNVSDSRSLLIINVTNNTDRSRYCCKARSILGKDESCSQVSKITYVAPKIDKGSPHQFLIGSARIGSSTFKIGGSQYIFAGYNFTITCKVLEGVPSPKIIWLKNDNAMEDKANLTHITVPVSIDDPAAAAGRYTCKATNVAGMDEAHSQIRLETEILVPPIIWKNSREIQSPLIIQSGSDVKVTIGTDVDIVMSRTLPTLLTLNCSLHHQALPNAKFTWTKNKQPLDDTDMIKIENVSDSRSLLIINVTNSTDRGRYCCKARSILGKDESCSQVSKITYTSMPEDQHVTRAAVIASTTIFSFILVIGIMVGIPVMVKCLIRRKGRKRDKKYAMSKILFLPSRRIYHGRAGSEEICGLATDDWEISPDDFKLQGNLGKGQFGDVKIALIENMSCTSKLRNYMDRRVAAGESLSTSSAVAVKYLRDTTTNEKRILFLEEIALMKKVSEIGNNHVVQLLGCITLKTPMAMVMEFCPFGDLRSNLIQWREEIGAQSIYVKPNSESSPDLATVFFDNDQQYVQEALEEGDLFSFAHQIAVGMSYLASMNLIHRDLACRNVLVGENKILKVSDFGLSKEIDGVYASKSNTKLPLRWMSPEAITHRLFSEKSDIWSYGVCLWEICTLGKIPYEDKTNAEVVKSVTKSVLLERPRTCHDEIYKMMLDCWKMKASDRPTFKDIENHFKQLIMNKCNHMYITIEDILVVLLDYRVPLTILQYGKCTSLDSRIRENVGLKRCQITEPSMRQLQMSLFARQRMQYLINFQDRVCTNLTQFVLLYQLLTQCHV